MFQKVLSSPLIENLCSLAETRYSTFVIVPIYKLISATIHARTTFQTAKSLGTQSICLIEYREIPQKTLGFLGLGGRFWCVEEVT